MFLIVFVFFSRKFLRAECFQDTALPVVKQAELLVRLFHRLFQVAISQRTVSFEMDLMDFGLFVLVDVDIYDHFTFMCDIVFLKDFDIHILKAFAIEELLDQRGRTIDQVRSHLVSFTQPQTGFQIFTFPLLDTMIVDFRNTRTLFQLDFQPNLISLYFSCQNLYIRE